MRLDGIEPERAEPSTGLPEEAVLALADSVRTWHEAQRPRDVKLEVRPGVELERRWLALATVGFGIDWFAARNVCNAAVAPGCTPFAP